MVIIHKGIENFMIDENNLGTDIEYLNRLYNPRGNLNDEESIEAITVLMERWGAICWRCKKPSWQLIIEDEAVRKAKGLPKRTRRILVVHEVIKGCYHIPVIEDPKNPPKLEKWSGCRPVCYSCNQIIGTTLPIAMDEKTMTWQSKRSVTIRRNFRLVVEAYMTKKIHICEKLAVNTQSSPQKLNCSQEVLIETVRSNVGTNWDLINIEEFNIKCEYCEKYFGNNMHVIFKGKPPTKIQTDLEAMLAEDEKNGTSE